jgi:hypothetical protein
MLEKIFENVNSELLTDEVKLQISTIFEANLNKSIKEKEEELEKDYEDKVEKVKEEAEEEIDDVKKEVKENLQKFKKKLVNTLESYISYFTDNFIKENREQIVSLAEVKQAEKIIDAFKESNLKFGMKLGRILEGVDVKENRTINKYVESYNDIKRRYDTLLSESKKVATFNLINEAVDVLNVSDFEKERIVKLMSNMKFNNKKEISEKARILKDFILNEGKNLNRNNSTDIKIIKESKQNNNLISGKINLQRLDLY